MVRAVGSLIHERFSGGEVSEQIWASLQGRAGFQSGAASDVHRAGHVGCH